MHRQGTDWSWCSANSCTSSVFEFIFQVDCALSLVRLGMERNIPGLQVLCDNLITLETVVYETDGDRTLTLKELLEMKDIEKLRLLMKNVSTLNKSTSIPSNPVTQCTLDRIYIKTLSFFWWTSISNSIKILHFHCSFVAVFVGFIYFSFFLTKTKFAQFSQRPTLSLAEDSGLINLILKAVKCLFIGVF